jgi:hypothetical protein
VKPKRGRSVEETLTWLRDKTDFHEDEDPEDEKTPDVPP